MRWLPIVSLTLLLACPVDDSDDGNASDSSEGSAESGREGGCGSSLCGCSEPATLEYEATTIDIQTDAPVAGVEVFCLGEDTPIATSDDAGLVGFSIETMLSPGCGYDRCNNLRFHATAGPYEDHEEPVLQSNGDFVEMTYPPD
jgi:hypothetical protein